MLKRLVVSVLFLAFVSTVVVHPADAIPRDEWTPVEPFSGGGDDDEPAKQIDDERDSSVAHPTSRTRAWRDAPHSVKRLDWYRAYIQQLWQVKRWLPAWLGK